MTPKEKSELYFSVAIICLMMVLLVGRWETFILCGLPGLISTIQCLRLYRRWYQAQELRALAQKQARKQAQLWRAQKRRQDLLRRLKTERRLRALGLANVDHMKGIDFEHYVTRLLEHQGFKANVTQASGDFGVDIIAQRDDVKYAVQVKRRQSSVSRRAVSDAVAGKAHFDCSAAMVVTNNFFTKGAREHARKTGCVLVDRDTLAEWIIGFQTPDSVTQPEQALEKPIELALSGNKAAARDLLLEIIEEEPNNELAWFWLAWCATSPTDRIHALEQVLRINPENVKAQTFLGRT